jgi:pimeloyl-ACP methyl ester carboxylesterase
MQAQPFVYNSENLKYYSAGSPDNPPIILVHGYTSSHHVWRQTIPVLKDHFYCVAIDLMGHGASDILPDGDYSIVAQAERVLALADELGFQQFTLIGHSMG